MIAVPGLINLDFADVKTIMTNRGSALMGIGIATGENRAAEAAKKAISSPLLETSVDGAKGVLMNITGGSNLSLYEVQEAAEIVSSASDEDVNMIFGSVINDELKDELIVTVIATGFDEEKQAQQQAQANRRPNQSIQVNRPNYAVQDEQQNDYAQNAPQQANAPVHEQQAEPQQNSSDVDVPAFIRNRNRRG